MYPQNVTSGVQTKKTKIKQQISVRSARSIVFYPILKMVTQAVIVVVS